MSETHSKKLSLDKKNKTYYLKWANIIILPLIVIFSIILFQQHFKIVFSKEIPLDQQFWSNAPGLVLIKNTSVDAPGVEIYRMKDAKQEKVDGLWNFSFTRTNQLFLYGSFPGEEDTQRLYVVTDRGSSKRDISKLPGPILSISENPLGTYLLISGLSQDPTSSSTFYSCVAEKQSPNLQPCDSVLGTILPEYDQATYYQSFWNQKNERELIIQELAGEQRIFSYDPWDDAPELVTNTEKHLIEKEASTNQEKINPNFFKRFGNVLAFKQDKKDKWALFTLPFGSDIRWADQDHLLVLTENQGMFLLDLTSGQKSPFHETNNSEEILISTYYSVKK